MRICHVIESASAGSAMIMAALALHAVEEGHEVHVVYSPGREDPQIIAALRKGGCASVIAVSMRRAIGPWDARDGMRLRAAIRALGPLDIIHAHSSKAGALTRLFCRFAGTGLVYSPHGFFTMTGTAPFYIGPVERALSLLGDRVIAVSDFERRHGIEIGIGAGRIVVVPNGIAPFPALSREEARAELGLDGDAFVVGFVGRFANQKNPLDAIRTANLMRTENRVLAMIGDGDLAEEARGKARADGTPVRFCGARAARPVYRAFDVLLCTSLYEGMSVSFLEALECGVPIVSYPVGGTEELIREGGTGFRVASDPAAAATALDRIAAMSADEREAMSRACRAMADDHSESRMGERTLEVYRDVIAERQPA